MTEELKRRVEVLEKTLERLCLAVELIAIHIEVQKEPWLAPRLIEANEPRAMVA